MLTGELPARRKTEVVSEQQETELGMEAKDEPVWWAMGREGQLGECGGGRVVGREGDSQERESVRLKKDSKGGLAPDMPPQYLLTATGLDLRTSNTELRNPRVVGRRKHWAL